MTDTRWHADAELLTRYSRGRLDHVGQAAVEAHVTRCPTCRATAAELVEAVELAPVWNEIKRGVAMPPQPLPFRALARLGARESDLVVLRASANMLLPLALAVFGALCFAIVSSFLTTGQQEFFYLAVAPLLPTLLVTGAYDTTDAVREIAQATPFSKLRIALLRTAVAVTGALPLVAVMGLVPDIDSSATATLLPSLALALLALTLLTRFTATVTMAALGTTWVAAVSALQAGGSLQEAFGPAAQLAYAVVALGLAAVFATQVAPGQGRTSRR